MNDYPLSPEHLQPFNFPPTGKDIPHPELQPDYTVSDAADAGLPRGEELSSGSPRRMATGPEDQSEPHPTQPDRPTRDRPAEPITPQETSTAPKIETAAGSAAVSSELADDQVDQHKTQQPELTEPATPEPRLSNTDQEACAGEESAQEQQDQGREAKTTSEPQPSSQESAAEETTDVRPVPLADPREKKPGAAHGGREDDTTDTNEGPTGEPDETEGSVQTTKLPPGFRQPTHDASLPPVVYVESVDVPVVAPRIWREPILEFDNQKLPQETTPPPAASDRTDLNDGASDEFTASGQSSLSQPTLPSEIPRQALPSRSVTSAPEQLPAIKQEEAAIGEEEAENAVPAGTGELVARDGENSSDTSPNEIQQFQEVAKHSRPAGSQEELKPALEIVGSTVIKAISRAFRISSTSILSDSPLGEVVDGHKDTLRKGSELATMALDVQMQVPGAEERMLDPMRDYPSIVRWLNEQREAIGLSRGTLADKLHVSEAKVSRTLSNGLVSIPRRTILDMAKVFANALGKEGSDRDHYVATAVSYHDQHLAQVMAEKNQRAARRPNSPEAARNFAELAPIIGMVGATAINGIKALVSYKIENDPELLRYADYTGEGTVIGGYIEDLGEYFKLATMALDVQMQVPGAEERMLDPMRDYPDFVRWLNHEAGTQQLTHEAIARHLGTSGSTVSRALHNAPRMIPPNTARGLIKLFADGKALRGRERTEYIANAMAEYEEYRKDRGSKAT